MARFESKVKGGSYPLLEEWRPLLARLFEPFKPSGGRKAYILDPFSNTGETVLHLADKLGLEPFAVELQDQFIPDLRQNFDTFYREHKLGDAALVRSVHDNSFQTTMSVGAFGIVVCNPPYDDMIITDPERHNTADAISRKERFELTALRKMFDRVAIGGYMVWIAYSQHMTAPVFNEFRRNCDKISVFRFPEPHLDHYSQVVVIGQYLKGHTKSRDPIKEKEMRDKFIEMGKNPELIKPLDEVVKILDEKNTHLFKAPPAYRAGNGVVMFRPSIIDPGVIEKLGQRYGVQNTAWFKQMTDAPEEEPPIQPQHRYNKSRIAALLAAGLLDGMEIQWKGKRSKVRGRTEDVAEVISEEHEDVELKDETAHRMTRTTLIHPGYHLAILSEDGTIEDVSETELMMQIVTDNAETMLAELGTRYKPFYDMTIHPVWRKMYKKLKVGGTSSFFRAQRYIVACEIEHLAVRRIQMEAVAPGGGKTSMTGGTIIGLRILDAAIQHRNTGKLNEIAQHFELTGADLESLLERFETAYGMKATDLFTIPVGQVSIVACPPIAPGIWLEQELPPLYPHFQMKQLKHVDDLDGFFSEAADDIDPRNLHVGVVTYMDAKLNEGVEPAAATSIKRYRTQSYDESGRPVVNALAVRKAVDPINGEPVLKEGKEVPWERFTPEKRGKELLFFEGKEFWGYKSEIVTDENGKRVVRPTRHKLYSNVFKGKLTPSMIEQNETEGWPKFVSRQYPLFSEKRRIGLPKVGNGRTITPMKERIIKPRTFQTVTWKNGFAERITVTTKGGMILVPDWDKQKPLNPKEKILDKWISYAGIHIVRDGKKSRPRVPIARELRRAYTGRIALFVADEVHLAKSNRTDTGAAFKDMLMASSAVVGLTGTLYGGKSSSLYSLAFHFSKEVRKRYGWARGTPIKWIEDMGVRKVIEKFDSQGRGNSIRSGGKRVGAPQVKEAAGTSPRMMHTIDPFTIWMSLDDIGDSMPEKEEHAIKVNFDPDQEAVYTHAYSEITAYDNNLIAKGDRSFMSSRYSNLLYLPDSMFRDNPVIHRIAMDKGAARRKYADVIEREVMVIPGLGDDLKAKERQMIAALKDDLADGRRVIISVLQTGTRDIRDRLLEIIHNNVKDAKVFTLDTSIQSATRHKHISKMVKQGFNVMVTNPGLITTAVSLNEWSVWYSIEFSSSLAVHSQATARINRPSQQHKKIVYRHFYYEDKFQTLAIQNIADKSKAAAVLYGTNPEDLSAMMGSGERVADFSSLIKAIDEGKAKLKTEAEINAALNSKSGYASWRDSAWFQPDDDLDDFGDSIYIEHEGQNGSEEEDDDDDLTL